MAVWVVNCERWVVGVGEWVMSGELWEMRGDYVRVEMASGSKEFKIKE